MAAKFELYKGTDNQYRWRFRSSNGRIIAVSSEGYWGQADCHAGIRIVKTESPTAPVEDQT